MSRWTHIRGGLELIGEIFRYDGKTKLPDVKDFTSAEEFEKARRKYYDNYLRSAYLPYPEEQFKLSAPLLGTRPNYKKKKDKDGCYPEESCLRVPNVYLYSLPNNREYIEKAFKLMPQGELGLRYSLSQEITDYSSSTYGWIQVESCLKKYYKEAIARMYSSRDKYNSYDYDRLYKYEGLDMNDTVINYVSSILVAIRDDVRYCSGVEMLKGLEEAIADLSKHGIDIEDGYIEWEDEYKPNLIFSFRKSRIGPIDEDFRFFITDTKNNKIVWSKTYLYKVDAIGNYLDEYLIDEVGKLEDFK